MLFSDSEVNSLALDNLQETIQFGFWSNYNWTQFMSVSKKLESVGRVTDAHRRLLGTREEVRVARGGSRVGL